MFVRSHQCVNYSKESGKQKKNGIDQTNQHPRRERERDRVKVHVELHPYNSATSSGVGHFF